MHSKIGLNHWFIYSLNLSKLVSAFICSGSEFKIWGSRVLKLLSPYLAVLWIFTSILFGLCVSDFVLWNISSKKTEFRLFIFLKTFNPSVLRCFISIVHFPDLSSRVLQSLSKSLYEILSVLLWICSIFLTDVAKQKRNIRR